MYIYMTNMMQLIRLSWILTMLYMFRAFFTHHQELMNCMSNLW